ncbi:pyridoxamine 5'-phosphate oxidase family protein [Streptomyces ossamyceticus]|nr:pyridoxamine 5'-phosphate oxidase family protein [Streptomyces ossamyceticus]
MAATQRRGRKIMMEPGELDAFLGAQRTCRVATVSADGAPHVSPLWFVWDGTSLWLYSITRSKRWSELRRDPRVAVVVDAGEDYGELRGVELSGTVEVVGEVPRTGEPLAELVEVERLFARKNFGIDDMPHDGRHAWLRLTPDAITSWDFRKLGPL